MHILNTLPQRLDSGATPTFTGLLAPSLTAPTDLTLAGGSTGASLVLGQGASGNVSLRPTNGIVKVTEGAGATSILQIPVAFGNAYLIGGNLNGGADAKYSYAAFQAQTMQIGRVNDAFSSFTETARFSNTGNLLIGTTTDAASLAGGLVVNGSGAGATSSSTSTGALRVTGGVGVGGAINAGGNLTSPDLIFGASGPSAKSSIAARAARQGLVFDGTANGPDVTQPAFGSADFTLATWVRVDSLADQRPLFSGASGNFYAYVATNGSLVINKLPSGNVTSTANVTAGKISLVVYTRATSGGVSTGTWYIDGVSGGSGTDASNYTTAINAIGKSGFFGKYLVGSVSPVGIYNRALSASEVVSLYEAGVPAGADYNNAGTTDIKPSAGTYAFWFGTGSISAATASSFTITAGASSLAVRNVSGTFSAVTGKRYRATIVASGLNSAADFGSQGFTSNLLSGNISNGTNVIDFTTTSTASGYFAISTISSTAGGSISISSIQALGLLLAPDAAQAGGGLTWYDTSGNAANITLPATGVTWNVPTSGKAFSLSLASSTPSTNTTSGALVVTGGVGVGGRINAGGTATAAGFLLSANTDLFSADAALSSYSTTNGVYLNGHAAGWLRLSGSGGGVAQIQLDGGASGAITMRTATANALVLNGTTGAATFAGAVTGKLITTQADDTSSGFVVKRSVNPYIDFYDGGTSGTIRAEISATNDGVSGGTLVLAPRNAAGTITTALTLTKDLAATFAGTVIAPAATTALAPMRIPHGTAPTSPVNGDMWTTTAGLFVRINGVTVGPLS